MVIPYSVGVQSVSQVNNTTPTYSVEPDNTVTYKNTTVTYTVRTSNVPNNTTLLWENLGSTFSPDFTQNNDAGEITINNNTATLIRTLINNVSVEGKTIIIQLRKNSSGLPVVAIASTVTVVAAGVSPTYSITCNSTQIVVNNSITYTITTTNVSNGTILYVSLDGYTGTSTSGQYTVTITNNSASLTATLTSVTTASFTTSLRTGSYSGTIVASVSGINVITSGSVTDNVISNLFANSVKGAWYDPSDNSTVFKDFANNQANANDNVVLLLDKSRGLALGPELITNGNFTSSTSGYLDSWYSFTGGNFPKYGGGNYLLCSSGGYTNFAYQNIGQLLGGVQAFKLYKLTVTVDEITTGSLDFGVYNDASLGYYTTGPYNGPISSVGTHVRYLLIHKTNINNVTPGSNSIPSQPPLNYFKVFNNSGGVYCAISYISLREVQGNHAFFPPSVVTGTNQYGPIYSAKVNLLNVSSSTVTSSFTIRLPYTNPSRSFTLSPLIINFTGTGSVTLSGYGGGTYSQGINTVTVGDQSNQDLIVTPSGQVNNLDIRFANSGTNIPSYQQVTSSSSYNTSGFPFYLDFDTSGIRGLMTNWFDFGYSNKATCFIGNKLYNNSFLQNNTEGFLLNLFGPPVVNGVNTCPWPNNPNLGGRFNLCTLTNKLFSSTLNGAYNTSAPAGTNTMSFSAAPTTNVSTTFPTSQIVVNTFDISLQNTNSVNLAVNNNILNRSTSGFTGTQLTSPLGDNYNLYIGVEWWYLNNINRPYPFRLYSLIIVANAISANSTTAYDVNTWINNKMGGGNLT